MFDLDPTTRTRQQKVFGVTVLLIAIGALLGGLGWWSIVFLFIAALIWVMPQIEARNELEKWGASIFMVLGLGGLVSGSFGTFIFFAAATAGWWWGKEIWHKFRDGI